MQSVADVEGDRPLEMAEPYHSFLANCGRGEADPYSDTC